MAYFRESLFLKKFARNYSRENVKITFKNPFFPDKYFLLWSKFAMIYFREWTFANFSRGIYSPQIITLK